MISPRASITPSGVACKETIAAVMALTYEENTLRSLNGIPVYILIDNSVLVSLLEQLEEKGHLANYFLTHPSFKTWVSKLHALVTKYNITVLSVSSELQLADGLSRGTHECANVQGKSTECELCPGCRITCIKGLNHAHCKVQHQELGRKRPKPTQIPSKNGGRYLCDRKNVEIQTRNSQLQSRKLPQNKHCQYRRHA